MVAALTSASGIAAGVAGMVIWALLAFIATVLAVARRRTVSARALLEASPVPA
jgi:putative membrane protein